jgi:hypothetical protein
MDKWKAGIRQAAAAIGIAGCVPAASLMIGGLLQTKWGTPALRAALERTLFNPELTGFRILIHPATILGGLALAAGLNLLPLLRLGLDRQPGRLVATLAVRVRAAHLGVAVFALGMAGAVLGYGFVENYKVVPTHVKAQALQALPGGAPRLLRVYDQRGLFLALEGRVIEAAPYDDGQSGWRYGATWSDEGTWLLVPTPPANDD